MNRISKAIIAILIAVVFTLSSAQPMFAQTDTPPNNGQTILGMIGGDI